MAHLPILFTQTGMKTPSHEVLDIRGAAPERPCGPVVSRFHAIAEKTDSEPIATRALAKFVENR